MNFVKHPSQFVSANFNNEQVDQLHQLVGHDPTDTYGTRSDKARRLESWCKSRGKTGQYITAIKQLDNTRLFTPSDYLWLYIDADQVMDDDKKKLLEKIATKVGLNWNTFGITPAGNRNHAIEITKQLQFQVPPIELYLAYKEFASPYMDLSALDEEFLK